MLRDTSLSRREEGKPLLSSPAPSLAKRRRRRCFSPMVLLGKFTRKFANHPSFLRSPRFAAAGVTAEAGGLGRRASAAVRRETSGCLFPAQACAPRFPGSAATSAEPFSGPPGATFVADSIWFHRASRRGRGRGAGGRLARPPSLPRSEQFTNCSRREPAPSPEQPAPVTRPLIVCGDRAPLPSRPACEWRDVKS